MTTTTQARPAVSDDRPGLIHATPVRHPGRWIAIAIIAVLALQFLHLLIFNPAFNWPFVLEAMVQSPVVEGFWKGTILVTILAMVFGVTLGVILAVMRLSDNPFSRVFRGCTPGSSAPSLGMCYWSSWASLDSSSQKASLLVCLSTGSSSNGSV
jgi:ABC-type phosphate transport system permease subunit